jgi:hypothetical protein
MSTIAVFGVLAGGGAYAASKIGTSDIENGAVTAKKLHKKAVTKKKVKNGAVTKAKLGDGAVRARNLGPIRVVSETLTVPNADNGQVAAFCPEGHAGSAVAPPRKYSACRSAGAGQPAPQAGTRFSATTPACRGTRRRTCSA